MITLTVLVIASIAMNVITILFLRKLVKPINMLINPTSFKAQLEELKEINALNDDIELHPAVLKFCKLVKERPLEVDRSELRMSIDDMCIWIGNEERNRKFYSCKYEKYNPVLTDLDKRALELINQAHLKWSLGFDEDEEIKDVIINL